MIFEGIAKKMCGYGLRECFCRFLTALRSCKMNMFVPFATAFGSSTQLRAKKSCSLFVVCFPFLACNGLHGMNPKYESVRPVSKVYPKIFHRLSAESLHGIWGFPLMKLAKKFSDALLHNVVVLWIMSPTKKTMGIEFAIAKLDAELSIA